MHKCGRVAPKKNETIHSYGLITYSKTQEGVIVFLLYQRRDTYEYIEFIRGLWSKANVPKKFNAFTKKELSRVRNHTHDELWDDFYVCKDYKTYKDFAKPREKYNSIRAHIPTYIDTAIPSLEDTPWGFPKGKKNGHQEDNISCAAREFEEETRFATSSFTFYPEISFKEEFIGSNGKNYSSTYYLAYSPSQTTPKYIETNNHIRPHSISEEAADLKWVTFEEACELLDERKIVILKNVMAQIQSINSNS